MAEMQAIVTVCPGVESGKPGENEKILEEGNLQ